MSLSKHATLKIVIPVHLKKKGGKRMKGGGRVQKSIEEKVKKKKRTAEVKNVGGSWYS